MNIDISPLFTAIASNINIDKKAATYVCVTALGSLGGALLGPAGAIAGGAMAAGGCGVDLWRGHQGPHQERVTSS